MCHFIPIFDTQKISIKHNNMFYIVNFSMARLLLKRISRGAVQASLNTKTTQ